MDLSWRLYCGLVAQWIGLIPLGALLLYRPPLRYRLVGAGLFVSWIADTLTFPGGFDPWHLSYLWLPVQMGLVLRATVATPEGRIWSTVWIGVLAVSSYYLTAPRPDVAITLGGSVTIMVRARGRMVPPLYLYFGAGTVAYFLMAAAQGADVLPRYLVYHGLRLAGCAAFAWSVHQTMRVPCAT